MEKLGPLYKKHMAKELADQLKKSQAFFLTNFAAIDVAKQQKLRKQFKTASGRFFVVKNSITKEVFKKLKFDPLIDYLDGTCGVGIAFEDPIATSKILVNFAKENEGMKIRAALIEGELVSIDKIRELAALPSREALIAKFVMTLNAPIVKFVSVISQTQRNFTYLLDKISKLKGNK